MWYRSVSAKTFKMESFCNNSKRFFAVNFCWKAFHLDYASDYHKQTQSSGGVLEKKMLLKISQNLHENTCARACNFIKKETLAYVFSCEFFEIFKNFFFKEDFWWLLLWFDFKTKNYFSLWGYEVISKVIFYYYWLKSGNCQNSRQKSSKFWKLGIMYEIRK